ncbi:MAG TPA: MBL fold metallo-hydrolase [Stellaceae bacterium]|nr:MBL fold metallo-hydrolase [Stellaceae bacterium]
MRSAAGTTIVLDCGTGALSLGANLVQGVGKPLHGHLLISHTHWDHIQGLPFFAPLFAPANEWDIYAPHGVSQSVRQTLAGQMQHTYFPVELAQLGATIRYHDLTEGVFTVGDIEVKTQYLNHPALTLGYRLEADGIAVVYCCDHEPHSHALGYGGGGEIGEQDRYHIEFAAGADLLIHDAQYRAAEYEGKIGWGHSTLEYAVALAKMAEVKCLAFTHHDPGREDDTIDREVEAVRADLRTEGNTSLTIFGAFEGQILEFAPKPVRAPKAPIEMAPAEVAATQQLVEQTVLLGVADSALYDDLWQALHADGVRVLRATDSAAAVQLAESENPALVVIERHLPGDGLAACQAIRDMADAACAKAPVVIVAAEEDLSAGTAAGVSDWLVKPFTTTYARTRMRAWLMRSTCHWMRPPVPKDEARRLAALHHLSILDTAPEERFDKLTRIATSAFDVPVALVSLIDENRQWFKSACGAEVSETPRDMSFCAHAILEGSVMIVPDALLDPRFADNPVVVNDPRVRFYAGCPLVLDGGACVGTLCLIDTRPRQLDETGILLLQDLASLVLQELQHPAS